MNAENTPKLPDEMLCRTCGNAIIYGSKSRINCFCKVTHREMFDIYDTKQSYIVLNCTDKVPQKKQPEQEAQ